MKNKVKPTRKQLATLEIKKANPEMPMGEAMVKAGYSVETSKTPKQKLVDSRGFQVALEQYQDELAGLGLTHKKVAEKMSEWIDAKKQISARNGKEANAETDDFIEVPDYQTQLKAGEMLRNDLGINKTNPDNLSRRIVAEEFFE